MGSAGPAHSVPKVQQLRATEGHTVSCDSQPPFAEAEVSGDVQPPWRRSWTLTDDLRVSNQERRVYCQTLPEFDNELPTHLQNNGMHLGRVLISVRTEPPHDIELRAQPYQGDPQKPARP